MKTLLALWKDRSRASSDVKALALSHIAELERKAAAIKTMTKTLKHLANNCHGDGRPECPIIDGISEPMREDGPTALSKFGLSHSV